ncbi:MAG TPA: hypothetical protein VFZ76_12975 [Anaerolineales bacterium]
MPPTTIMGINQLSPPEKRDIYARFIPRALLDRFNLSPYLVNKEGEDLLSLNCPNGASSAEMALYHRIGFPDPILYGEMTDTLNGQIHVLLYVLNDPASPRFDVDIMPDGTPTKFGTRLRNIDAEAAAMQAGLAPGQIRSGLRMLSDAIDAFEHFVKSLHHDLYFVEPLYYHNAVVFERYGFAYQQGRRLMERIHTGFAPGGDLIAKLDGSTPFRQPGAADSIRLRSWAIHDGILGEPFDRVTMYKQVDKSAGVITCPDCSW